MTDERFKLSRQAQKAGGPCPVCGWKDGDGVTTCFYSADLGAVTHQNTDAGAEATMTPAQRSLYELRIVHAFASIEAREAHIAQTAEERQRRGNFAPGWTEADEAAWLVDYRAQMEKKPLATAEPYCGWVQRPWQWLIECREPHADCGGVQVFVGPYHFACSKCDTEVKLWEHGIDYDIG